MKDGLDRLVYYWDNSDETVLQLNGKTGIERKINLPNGRNTLNLKVIDIYGNEKTCTQYFEYNVDDNAPILNLSIIEDEAKLKISAEDDKELKYVKYQWNEEEEQIINPSDDNKSKIEETVEIKRGKNIIKITAVDFVGNEATEEMRFNGVNDPKIDVYVSNGKLHIKASHDMGFEKLAMTINGTEYVYDENYSGYDATREELEFTKDLKEGENIIIIQAHSTEDTTSEYRGMYNHVLPQ